MKIDRVRADIVGNPWKNWVIVRVDTDEGITGYGEATALTAAPQVAEAKEVSRFVIGMDPRDPVRVRDALYKGTYLNMYKSTCAIEIACWDILARSLGVPLYRLLGGRVQSRLRVYANGWYKTEREPQAIAQRAREVVAMGYTAMKFDPFGSAYLQLSRAERKLSLAIVAAVRDAVGDEVDLLIEGHDRFTPAVAVELGHALATYEPTWFETPVNSRDVEATCHVARQIPVPVASGELFKDLEQFRRLLADGSVGIVQPEPLNCGGVSGVMKAAAIAEAHGALVACHQAQSPLNTALNAHLHTAMPNFFLHECFDEFLEPWARAVFPGVPRVVDGYLEPSDERGLGVGFDEREAERHPYGADQFIRLFEVGWEQRRR